MGIEAKGAQLKALNDKGEGAALFAVWDAPDLDHDVPTRGFFGDGVQECWLLPHHLWTSGQPPLGKGIIYERGEGAVYEFRMNLDLDAARAWHSHFQFDLREGRTPRQQWSYGFRVSDGGSAPRPGGSKGRVLKALSDGRPGCAVIEVSPVTQAAQPLGRTLGAKAGTPLTPAQQAAWEKVERQLMKAIERRRDGEQAKAWDLHRRWMRRAVALAAGGGR
jgi:hypothetical protein